MESNGREDIALLCLAYRETLDDNYKSLIGELSRRYNLVRLPTASIARTYLANHSPKIIIVTDGGISEPDNQDIAKRLNAYLEDGGSVTFALDFASSISGDEFKNLFGRKFGTPWEYDGRCKTIWRFNGNCIVPAGPVPNCFYDMEALLIKNASPIERIVVPLGSSMFSIISVTAELLLFIQPSKATWSPSAQRSFFYVSHPQTILGIVFEPLLKRLRERANVKRATTIDEALRGLEANPKVVIVADEGVTIPVNRLVVEELEDYMRRGGLAIFGLCFPGFVTKDRFRSLFHVRIGLPWIIGDKERTKFEFNPECTLPAGTEAISLPSLYSMEAVFIKNARPKEKIYITVKGAMTERTRPEPVDQTQDAVVGAKVGDGYVAYCGDTNPGKELEQVILALCGF